MADEATIKIEVEGSSGGGGPSPASESAGGKLRSQEDILKSILGGEEGLLSSLKDPGTAAKNATEDLLKNYVSDVFGNSSVFSTMVGGGGTGAVEGAAATAGATAATAGGGAATAGAATGLAGALSALLAALGPATQLVAGLAVAVGVASAAVISFSEILTSVYTSMADAWAGVSGAMQQANALYEVQMTQTKLNTRGQVETGYAAVMGEKQELDSDLLRLRADITEILVPAVYVLIELAKGALIPIKMATETILDIYHLITAIYTWGEEQVSRAFSFVTFWKSEDKDPKTDQFAGLLQKAMQVGAEQARSRLNPWENKKRARYGEKG